MARWPMSRPPEPPGTPRGQWIAFLGLVAVQVAIAAIWVRPGPLSIDEVLYQWMARSAAEGQPLTLSNGYEELASRELATIDFMRTRGGTLTSQYPLLFPILAAPLYAMTGFLGLFLLNAAAFAGVLVFCWRIGNRLLGSGGSALAACAVLAVGTFAWEYSMAAWPHMATLLLQVAAFDLALVALLSPRAPGRTGSALLAGVLLGVAVGFRRDAVFFLPVVGLPFLFATPPRLRALGALVLGALAPLVLVGWLNWLRWRIWVPISYGNPQMGYRSLAVVGMVGLAGLALLAAPGIRRAVLDRPRTTALAVGTGLVGLFLLPSTNTHMVRILQGAESLLIDLRGSATTFAGGERTDFGAVIYAGGVKKALLQSLPWLPVLLLAGRRAWRDVAARRSALLLALPVVVYVGVSVFFDRHGGMSVNMRYFLPALPFLALLAVMAVEPVWEAATHGRPRREDRGFRQSTAIGVVVASAAVTVSIWALVRPAGFDDPAYAQIVVLAGPLALAVVVTVAVLAWILLAGSPVTSLVVLGAVSVACSWSAMIAFDYDARWSREIRTANRIRSLHVAEQIASHSLLFARLPDWHGSVPEFRDDVIVAFPRVDGYADFRRLATFHLDAGRLVYAALAQEDWRALEAGGHLRGLELRPVGSGPDGVVELRRQGS